MQSTSLQLVLGLIWSSHKEHQVRCSQRGGAAHILTMRYGSRRNGDADMRAVSFARERKRVGRLVGWLVGRSVGRSVARSTHAYANHIRRRASFQAEMSTGQFRRAIDYHSISVFSLYAERRESPIRPPFLPSVPVNSRAVGLN